MADTGATTCAVCGRVVLVDHVNRSGRCVNCAGLPEAKAVELANAPVPAAAVIADQSNESFPDEDEDLDPS